MTDRVVNRRDQLRGLRDSSPLRNLASGSVSRYFVFGASARPLLSVAPDSLSLNEDATDISSALHTLSLQKEDLNIHAILLVTDGAYNLGQNPVYEAEHLGLPLYSVGIGDSAEQKDVLVGRIATNDLVYSGAPRQSHRPRFRR